MVRLWPRSKSSSKPKSNLPDHITHETADGLEIQIALRPNSRARRLSLRYDAIAGQMRLSFPTRISITKLQSFVASHEDWILKQLQKHPDKQNLQHGDEIQILGQTYQIYHHADRLRGLTECIENEIHIYGEASQINRKLTQYLKKQAKEEIQKRAHDKAAHINKKVGTVSIKDTRSRWGSCSSEGNLSFSWRLIMAPDDVFDYVIAHEVAHLQHMDHSSDFWALCDQLTPNMVMAKNWLKHHSQPLYII